MTLGSPALVDTQGWFATDRPTRAVNVAATLLEVQVLCASRGAAISAIEALPGGNTHVVLVTMEGADAVRRAYKGKLLDRQTPRMPLRFRRNDP
jgi:hypothetical protein